jgi:hypothetical protein
MRQRTRFWAVISLLVLAACSSGRDNPPATGEVGTPGGSPLEPLTLRRDGNFHIAPTYAPDAVFTEQPGVPKGRVVRFEMNSDDSAIYPTINGADGKPAPYKQQEAVYVPAGYRANTLAPFIVVQDGVHWYAGGQPNSRVCPTFPPCWIT